MSDEPRAYPSIYRKRGYQGGYEVPQSSSRTDEAPDCPLGGSVNVRRCERCRWFGFWMPSFLNMWDNPGTVFCKWRPSWGKRVGYWLRTYLGRN